MRQRLQGFALRIQDKYGHAQVSRFPSGLQLEAVVGMARVERTGQLAHDMVVVQRTLGVLASQDR